MRLIYINGLPCSGKTSLLNRCRKLYGTDTIHLDSLRREIFRTEGSEVYSSVMAKRFLHKEECLRAYRLNNEILGSILKNTISLHQSNGLIFVEINPWFTFDRACDAVELWVERPLQHLLESLKCRYNINIFQAEHILATVVESIPWDERLYRGESTTIRNVGEITDVARDMYSRFK